MDSKQYFNRMKNSLIGRATVMGTKEAFGWQYSLKGEAEGFLGMSKTAETLKAMKIAKASFLSRAGMAAWRTVAGTVAPIITGAMIYGGYKSGGIGGAIKEGATAIGFGIASRAAIMMLGGPVLPTVATIAALGIGTHALGEASIRHRKRLQAAEFGTPEILGVLSSDYAQNMRRFSLSALNNSTYTSTMRQRSLLSLQNTHLNARIALGQEASMIHI